MPAPQPAALDAQAIARLREGESGAMEAVYRQYAPAVYRYALAMSGNRHWADDALQEAFLALAQNPCLFDPLRGALSAYIAGTARHHLLRQMREAPGEPSADQEQPDTTAEPLAQLISMQDTESLWHALRSQPWPYREAVVLVDIQERSYAEAAAIAGITTANLKTRLHRGRQRLASALACTRQQGLTGGKP